MSVLNVPSMINILVYLAIQNPTILSLASFEGVERLRESGGEPTEPHLNLLCREPGDSHLPGFRKRDTERRKPRRVQGARKNE